MSLCNTKAKPPIIHPIFICLCNGHSLSFFQAFSLPCLLPTVQGSIFINLCPATALYVTSLSAFFHRSTSTLCNLWIPGCQPSQSKGDRAERGGDKEQETNSDGVFFCQGETKLECHAHQNHHHISFQHNPWLLSTKFNQTAHCTSCLHAYLLYKH